MEDLTPQEQFELQQKADKLKQINQKLQKRVEEEVYKNRIKDEMMFHQSRFASMGEMIGNIAHQWRQPLMELSTLFMNIEAQIKLTGEVSKEDVLQSISKSNEITKYLSATIDDFRNFFAKDKEIVCFKISDQINSAINIISSGLKNSEIQLDIIVKKNSIICGYKNEYSQVIINIVNNAKDILLQRNIEEPKITVLIDEDETHSILKIKDNAGGIELEDIQKIFEPFFTYGKAQGTGIGLFMSKVIIENNMKGSLSVSNEKQGAQFTIKVPRYQIKNRAES